MQNWKQYLVRKITKEKFQKCQAIIKCKVKIYEKQCI